MLSQSTVLNFVHQCVLNKMVRLLLLLYSTSTADQLSKNVVVFTEKTSVHI